MKGLLASLVGRGLKTGRKQSAKELPMSRAEAERVLRQVEYWHYGWEFPWGRANATKPNHNERHDRRWQHFFKPILEGYGGFLRGKRVLDLGCCQGFWSFKATAVGADFCLGIDSSPTFIREARALATLLGNKNCEFRCAHLEEAPSWEGLAPFHVTLFLGLFYHLTDPIFVFRKAMQLTQETIVVDTEITTHEDCRLTLVPRDMNEPTTRSSNLTSRIRTIPTKKALQELLKDSGFTEIQFLTPRDAMPPEYLQGYRVSVIARRNR